MHIKPYFIYTLILTVIVSLLSISCRDKEAQAIPNIAVLVPGMLEDKLIYKESILGIQKSAKSHETSVKIWEAPENYAQLVADLASQQHDLIITFDPPASIICNDVAQRFPNQNFLVIGGSGEAGPNVNEIIIKRFEQAFVMGYLAGLMTGSKDIKHSNNELKVGIAIDKDTSQSNTTIKPGFEIGLHMANPNILLSTQQISTTPGEAESLKIATSIWQDDIDVLLLISSRQTDTLINAINKKNIYSLWIDINGQNFPQEQVFVRSWYDYKLLLQDWLDEWMQDRIDRGDKQVPRFKDGYVQLSLKSGKTRRQLSRNIINAMNHILNNIKDDSLNLSLLED